MLLAVEDADGGCFCVCRGGRGGIEPHKKPVSVLLSLSISQPPPPTRARATIHLHCTAHKVIQARVQGTKLTGRQHAADDKEAVALQFLPLQLREVEGGGCIVHDGEGDRGSYGCF